MTRWHEDDLAGRLLKEQTLPWEEIKIPAIAEDDDLLGRKPGEALAPEIGKDEEWAAKTKAVTGSRGWAALYQQRPTPAGGNIFKRSWIKFYVPTLEKKVELNLGDDVVILPRLLIGRHSRGTVLSKTPKPLTMFLVKCGARREPIFIY